MLEGDEVLDVAQETGYRLCRMANEEVANKKLEEKQLVFSVTWDLNNNRRMYMCMQDGQLKAIDLDVPQQYESHFERIISASTRHQWENNHEAECLVHDYNVRFRRFIGPHEAPEPDRPINYHWDKIASIPGRPDELIFLLGISKTILYTSLPASEGTPYPSKPLLSSITRGDFSGFIYGTPIMQICAHSSRVTSLSTSPRGQLMASGDEQGNVRIIMLQLLQELTGRGASSSPGGASVVNGGQTPMTHASHNSTFSSPMMHMIRHNQHSQYANTHVSVGIGAATPRTMNPMMNAGGNTSSKNMRRPFQANYDLTKSCHKGPIFSLAWLPIIESYNGHPVFGLATGSADRVVRLWRIETSAVHGVSMTPCMVLDTLSTHILSLSILQTRSYEEDEDWEEVEHPPIQLYVSAGTNLGTVHVWKIPMQELQARLSSNPLSPEANALVTVANYSGSANMSPVGRNGMLSPVAPATNFNSPTAAGSVVRTVNAPTSTLAQQYKNHSESVGDGSISSALLDDGRYLVSVLQPTDQPVIHVSMTNISGTMKRLRHFSGEVVLVASDTQGHVNIYASDDGKLTDNTLMASDASSNNQNEDVLMLTSAQHATDFYLKQMRLKYESRQVERQQHQNIAAQPATRLNFQENSRQRQLYLAEGLGEVTESFVPIKHHVYKNVVVGCTFSSGQLLNPTIAQSGIRFDGYEKGGELLICTMQGHVRVYNDLLARDYHKKKLQNPQTAIEYLPNGITASPQDWLDLQAQFDSDLDSSDDEQAGHNDSKVVGAPLDPNIHPNQARAAKPLQNSFGEPFVLRLPPSIPTFKNSNLSPIPAAKKQANTVAENTGLVAAAVLTNARSKSTNAESVGGGERNPNKLTESLETDELLPPPPPPPLPQSHTHASAHHAGKHAHIVLDSETEAHLPRPRATVPKPTPVGSVTKQVNATSSLLKPTAAFVAKTTANTDTFPIKSKIKVKANGVPSSKEQENAESEKDGMSVASGVSRGSRATGIHSRASGVSLAGSSAGSSSGRSKRPTEEEIAYEEHLNVLQDKLPYPIALPPAPYPVREIDDLDEDNEDEDRLTTGQKHLMKQLAENEARVWSNPFSSPALYSTRHVEHAVQSLSEKFVTVPTAKPEQGSADVDENKEDESDYFHREQDTENKWEDITVSTVQTTQSDRMRALQALQRHYRKHPGGHESESDDTDSSPMPVAQYLDAKDQEQLLKNFAHGKYAGNNVRKPVTGVWKKSSPVVS